VRRSGLFIALGALVVVILIVLALIPHPDRPPVVLPANDGHDQIVTLERAVVYCPEHPVPLPHGRIQVLIDGSGSMKGVRTPVLAYSRWIEQAISRLRGSALEIDNVRIAQFDRSRHFLNSASFRAFQKDYAPLSDTTLHEAVTASKDAELTFILTDGVAAAGAGSGDCAAGVDAACVARALKEAIHLEQTTLAEPNPGIWIVPLWTKHNGSLYTEKPLSIKEFKQDESLKRLQTELDEDISISNPKQDRAGNLYFDYIGPRGLLLIIIAHSADLGRSAVAALRERMTDNGVEAVQSPQKIATSLASLPPIEIYPGYIPATAWTGLAESDDHPPKGTIDVKFAEHRRIELDCPRDALNESEFILSSRSTASPRCVEIYQFPAFEFAFVPKKAADQEALSSFLSGYERTAGPTEEKFRLHLRCGKQTERPCGSNPVAAQWAAQSRYESSGPKAEGGTSGAAAIVDSISTSDLSLQPHRIYGVRSLLTVFYDEVRGDRRQIVLADLDFCHQAAAGK
jgi:hypothetical protein